MKSKHQTGADNLFAFVEYINRYLLVLDILIDSLGIMVGFKSFALLVLLAVYMHFTVAFYQKPIYDLKHAPELFIKFIQDYKRHYSDTYDLLYHYEAFKYSLRDINENNSNPSSATFDINQFTDYTPSEWKLMNQ